MKAVSLNRDMMQYCPPYPEYEDAVEMIADQMEMAIRLRYKSSNLEQLLSDLLSEEDLQ